MNRVIGSIILLMLAVGGGYGFYKWWGADAPGDFVPSLGNNHIASPSTPHIPYNSDPPTSGPHVSYVARWGIHAEPVPKEVQVHNLEDAGVVIQYNCMKAKDCNALRDQLWGIAHNYDHVVLAPYNTMDSLIALTAWTRIKKLDRVDEKKIRRFIDAYIGIDHHPQKSF